MAGSEKWKIAVGIVIGLSILTAVGRRYTEWQVDRQATEEYERWQLSMMVETLPATPLAEGESCFRGHVYRRVIGPLDMWAVLEEAADDGSFRTCVPDMRKLLKPPK